jgi:hypothetical protein
VGSVAYAEDTYDLKTWFCDPLPPWQRCRSRASIASGGGGFFAALSSPTSNLSTRTMSVAFSTIDVDAASAARARCTL